MFQGLIIFNGSCLWWNKSKESSVYEAGSFPSLKISLIHANFQSFSCNMWLGACIWCFRTNKLSRHLCFSQEWEPGTHISWEASSKVILLLVIVTSYKIFCILQLVCFMMSRLFSFRKFWAPPPWNDCFIPSLHSSRK